MRKPKRSRRYSLHSGESSRTNVARSGGVTLSSHLIGGLPIINRFLERLRLVEHLQAYLPADNPRAKISTPKGILVLLKNILLAREPIYGIGEWAAEWDPNLVGVPESLLGALNDDRIGRCLDRLFDADYRSLALAVVSHAIREFGVNLDELHNDSTTITFSGSYPDAYAGRKKRGKQTLALTFGYNKDHRPDLKQLLFILTVSSDGGVPVHFNAADGNVTDDQTHLDTWKLLCQLTGRKDFLYVADSKLAVSGTMTAIDGDGGRFITVLPRTRAEDRSFRQRLRHETPHWKEIYRKVNEDTQEATDIFKVDEQPATTKEGYRLLWFFSSRKKELDQMIRAQRIDGATQDLADLRERLSSPRTRLQDRKKIEKVVEDILTRHQAEAWIRVEVEEREIEIFSQEQPGRPGKDTRYLRRTRTRFDLSFAIDTVAVSIDAVSDGIFPLITNDKELTPLEILLAYKRQAIIEKRYQQLKTDFVVAPVFLKEVARIEALLCVYFFAMLVQALIERQMRKNMAAARIESLPLYPEGRPCKAPCVRRVLDFFANIQRHLLIDARSQHTNLVTSLSRNQRRLLEVLDVPENSYDLAN